MELSTKSEKKILTIDLSAIMQPSAGLYDHLIYNTTMSADEIWGRLDKTPIIKKSIQFDSRRFLHILEIITTFKEKNKPIIFTTTQKEIIDDLITKDETYSIVNIDHCHDIFYENDDIDKMQYMNDYTENNWIGYIYKHEKVSDYIWLGNPNSYRPIESTREYFPFIITNQYQELSWNEINIIKEMVFDTIYVALSPRWVPYRYYYLYDILKIVGKGKNNAKSQ